MDQLALSEPSWKTAGDVAKFFQYRDSLRIMQFLMALNHDYEPIRGSILHRGSLPTLEGAMPELLSEEVRLNILKPSTAIDTNNVLAVPPRAFCSDKSTEKFCNYCRRQGQSFSNAELCDKNKSRAIK